MHKPQIATDDELVIRDAGSIDQIVAMKRE
jgi:hypothetical protein